MSDTIYEEEYFTQKPYKPYGDFTAHKFRAKRLVRMFQPKTVLDVGCAYGYIVKYLCEMGVDAVGIDVSHWAITQSQKIVPGRCKVHDMRKPLPFKDKQFNLLYCEGVLEHIEEEFVSAIMAEFDRVAHVRLLGITFTSHPNAEDEPGHIALKSDYWWSLKVPYHTWMILDNVGSEANHYWLVKG